MVKELEKKQPDNFKEHTSDALKDLILFNDDVNTFEYVIKALIEVCNHEPEQAEQCTMIVHYKGKCAVKHGAFDHLKTMCAQLTERGLTASIK